MYFYKRLAGMCLTEGSNCLMIDERSCKILEGIRNLISIYSSHTSSKVWVIYALDYIRNLIKNDLRCFCRRRW
jgi:hypothetical protein